MQQWVREERQRVFIVIEGRDAAGKGGVIKRMTDYLNPRWCRIAALPAPSDREQGQWYVQRYTVHLPTGGEIVLFDRSWYNRAGVETGSTRPSSAGRSAKWTWRDATDGSCIPGPRTRCSITATFRTPPCTTSRPTTRCGPRSTTSHASRQSCRTRPARLRRSGFHPGHQSGTLGDRPAIGTTTSTTMPRRSAERNRRPGPSPSERCVPHNLRGGYRASIPRLSAASEVGTTATRYVTYGAKLIRITGDPDGVSSVT